jgi:glycosyltransferase involved in cell wall biosynthesis
MRIPETTSEHLSEVTAKFVASDSALQASMNEPSILRDRRKSAPLVSVVVDTYNHEAFIADAITSVLQQEYQLGAVEILVVDDGSRDGTAEQLSAFADRVRIIRKENGGQASALNLGVTSARGDIIAFLDGDDWWHPRKLAAVVGYLLQNPTVGMVGHGIVEVAADGSQRALRPSALIRFDLKSERGPATFKTVTCFLGTSRLTCRRSVLERLLPIPEALVIEADEYLFTLGGAVAEVAVLDELLCYYRLHSNNLYQFGEYDPARLRRKHSAVAELADALPKRLMALGVSDANAYKVIENTAHDARRLGLTTYGGHIGTAFWVEWAIMRAYPEQRRLARLPVKAVMLLLALALPPKLFYRLRDRYSILRKNRR